MLPLQCPIKDSDCENRSPGHEPYGGSIRQVTDMFAHVCLQRTSFGIQLDTTAPGTAKRSPLDAAKTVKAENFEPRVGPFANPRCTQLFVRLNGDCSTTLLVSSYHLHVLSSLEPSRSKSVATQAAKLQESNSDATAAWHAKFCLPSSPDTGRTILSPNLLLSTTPCSYQSIPRGGLHK